MLETIEKLSLLINKRPRNGAAVIVLMLILTLDRVKVMSALSINQTRAVQPVANRRISISQLLSL